MLEFINISKNFGSKNALRDLSFSISKGKIFGLLGPNGAGKTTSLRILLNILQPTSGEVLFNSKKITDNFYNLTGYLPEERGLYTKSKIEDILWYLSKLKGFNKNESSKKIEYWLERLNLIEYKKRNLEELSKGNQQKVQFISAILHDPEILILDEPFSGFDPVNQSIFSEIISELKPNKYIILSTHLMDLAEELCDEICLLNNGENILSGDLNNILASAKIKHHILTLNNDEKELDNSDKFEILEQNSNKYKIKLKNILPEEFIKEISQNYNIAEFYSVKPTLHEIFLSLVN